jgi:hypothetical protein
MSLHGLGGRGKEDNRRVSERMVGEGDTRERERGWWERVQRERERMVGEGDTRERGWWEEM